MAQDVADALGVELELVAVQSSNRMQFLEQGKIDLMIATMSDREDRRKIVGIPQPNYYTSGTNVLVPKAVGLKDWEELRDKPVCGKQGAFYNQIVEEQYGAKIVAFTGNAESKQALRDKNLSPGSMTIRQLWLIWPAVTGMTMKCRCKRKMTILGHWLCRWRRSTGSGDGSCPA